MSRFLLVLILFAANPLCAQGETYTSKWDIYLDHAYELTYWDEEELQLWIAEREKEFDQRLSQYTDEWHERIKGPQEEAEAVRTDSGKISFSEDVYKRLAVAEYIRYLTLRDKRRLDEAIRIIELLKSKLEKPEIAYWYFFLRANQDLSESRAGVDGASEQFVKHVFRIWLDIILPREEANAVLNIPGIPVSMRDFSFSLPYLYENIADLILTKAIVQNEMKNIGALGVIVQGLDGRLNVQNGYAGNVGTIVNRMSGPKSDGFHMNYTVVFLEAEENRFETQRKLNEEGPSPSTEKAFEMTRHFYSLAYTWAQTKQGKAAVLSDYLDLISFAYSRLPDRETFPAGSLFAELTEHEGLLTIEKAVDLYEDLARPEIRGNDWKSQGFPERKDYVSAMHSLWDSIAELSLWSVYHREKSITLRDIENYSEKVIPSQSILQLHLNFFERMVKEGYLDIIPENAYFNAAEAAAKYADLFHRLAPYRPGMTNYYRSFIRLLQYIEIFPYNPEAFIEIAEELNNMGKPELYVQYVLPLAERVKGSDAVRYWKNKNGNDTFVDSIERLHRATPDIILKANTLIYLRSKGYEIVRESIKKKLAGLQEEIKINLNGNEPDLGSDNHKKVMNELDLVLQSLNSDDSPGGNPGRDRFVQQIKQVKREILELEEAHQIIVRLPEYIEISRKLRQNLAQKIDHSMHTILRRFFHEIPFDKKSYYQTRGMIRGVTE